jgi:hypothetical protein
MKRIVLLSAALVCMAPVFAGKGKAQQPNITLKFGGNLINPIAIYIDDKKVATFTPEQKEIRIYQSVGAEKTIVGKSKGMKSAEFSLNVKQPTGGVIHVYIQNNKILFNAATAPGIGLTEIVELS